MSKILDNLYLGCYGDARNFDLLKKLKVTHIVNVAMELKPVFPKDFTYLNIAADDRENFRLIKYFDEITEFMYKAINEQKGVVFVHCMWGISRSATAVIAYLIKHEKMSYLKALRFVKAKRSIVYPNLGFVKQLQEWEAICKKIASKIKNETKTEDNDQENKFFEETKTQEYMLNQKTKLQSRSTGQFHNLAMTMMANTGTGTITNSPYKNATFNNSNSHANLNSLPNVNGKSEALNYEYKCRLCKTPLFNTKDIIHYNIQKKNIMDQCTYIFIESITWMRNSKTNMTRIFCKNSKCNEIIGVYYPNNSKCSCGFCIKPAYQIFPVKIEKSKLNLLDNIIMKKAV